MNFLAIDSSSSILSVAISKDAEVLYTDTEAGMKQSECIMGCIDNLIKKAKMKPDDLDAVLCMGGPGSFTGLRIGYSTAKGLAFSLSIPFIPIPTLYCMAFPYLACGLTLAAVEARKNAWFYAVYHKGKTVIPAADADAVKISCKIASLNAFYNEKITVTGAGAASLNESMPRDLDNIIIIDAEKRGFSKELIAIAKNEKLVDNYNEAMLYSGPDYIRKTDAELSLSKKLD